MNYKTLKKQDPLIYKSLEKEIKRQIEGLEMIPAENYVSEAVLEAMGSILTNKYSEGYPNKRYYGGNTFVDEIETLACERAKKLFKAPYANVQPYSGSPANQAVAMAVLNPGDTMMGLNLYDGGHLTHGAKASFSSHYYKSIAYHVGPEGIVDFAEVRRLILEHKPKLIWIGGSAYVRELEFELFAKLADTSGAYLAADIAHVAGLIVGGVHKTPAPYVHIITTTTHKTLRGPKGAMILVTNKGLKKDAELGHKIDKAVFPGLQGGPHNHIIAGIAVALKEASSASFQKYTVQIVKNAKVLAKILKRHGLNLVGGGTENHLILLNLVKSNGAGSGILVQDALGVAGITVNKNTIPGEPFSPFYPSGIRLGSPALTSRGMKEREMEKIAEWLVACAGEVSSSRLPLEKEERIKFLKEFRKNIEKNNNLKAIEKDVTNLCKKFPVPGIN
ncbi:MAG: serine hydroxymethyltransferase [Patescibacteria group bacterium]